ncbi:MAG: hypothetical protein QXR45_14660 [Candidatus Bathyarchaeia archaeon]
MSLNVIGLNHFLKGSFEGVRRFDKELIELLKKGRVYSEEDILAHLGIDASDAELVKAVSRQLEVLEA